LRLEPPASDDNNTHATARPSTLAIANDIVNDIVNLKDNPEARRYSKRPDPVEVEIASREGSLQTLEGEVRYLRGDALMTGVAGERWPIERSRFDATYEAVPPTIKGQSGCYRRRPNEVFALQMTEAFEIATANGDRLRGRAGDWLVQYGEQDVGVVRREIFSKTYVARGA
jgi:hypothetical protein